MAEMDALEQLRRLETIDDASADEAARLLGQTRTTPDEGRAVEVLLARHSRTPLPESLLIALASVLVDRGDDAAAEVALSRASSSPALLLRADLRAHAADLNSATALIERVLLRDIDFPGARGRHARWSTGVDSAPRESQLERAHEGANPFVANRADVPFHVIREVARGGAGTVYEAEDRDLGRRIALKVYHRPRRDRAQLAHEARVAATLAGPGVVRVWDVNLDGGWLAMQWAPRGALSAHLCAARLSSRERQARTTAEPRGDETPLVQWARALAGALARVHDAGWAHLDVKPANVLLHATEAAMLTDFGIARRFGEPSPLGSFGYVSPERIAGRPSDPRDDIYGFGRVLEDALAAVSRDESRADWRALAIACTGPEAARPRTGSELVAMVEKVATEGV